MMKSAPRIRLLAVATTLFLPAADAVSPETIAIPKDSIQLGTNMEEVVRAAAECAFRQENRNGEACAPESFHDELSRGPRVQVQRFRIDRTEVSVGDYEHCVKAGRCRAVDDPRRIESFRRTELPMVFVTFAEASTYCQFVGKRLPSEAEFELAARGSQARRYPWGQLYHHGRANSGRVGSRVTNRRDGYELLAPTDKFAHGATPRGVLNLAGNAAEWVSSPYAPHGDSQASATSPFQTVKGGSFMKSPVHLRGSAREGELRGTRRPDLGFRCASSTSSGPKDSKKLPNPR